MLRPAAALPALILGGCFYLSGADLAARLDAGRNPADSAAASAADSADSADSGDTSPDTVDTADSSPDTSAPDLDLDGFPADIDCNDADPDVFPGAEERCNGVDDDCDGDIDEGAIDALPWHPDADGDGYGDAATIDLACSVPTGDVTDGTDCDDGEITAYPGSHEPETPLDGVDTDCDGLDVCTDLDCDGWADLVFPNSVGSSGAAESSYVYLSDAGAFDTATQIPFDTEGAVTVVAGDIDGDGYVDLVFGGSGTGYMYLYYGSAAGPGGTPTTFSASSNYTLCLADLDADADLDLIQLNYGTYGDSGTSSIIWWNDGGLGTRITALPTYNARTCLAEDFDGDGLLDIAITNRYKAGVGDTDSFVYWARDGYVTPTELPTHTAVRLLSADFDGNGENDLAFADYGSGGAADSFVYYNHSGAFSAGDYTALAGSASLYLAVGDVDGGGTPDVVLSSYSTGSSYRSAGTVFNGETTLAAVGTFAMVGGKAVNLADLDQDGDLDLVVSNSWDGATYNVNSTVFINSGGTFGGAVSLPTHGSQQHVIGDLNLDGWPDIVFGNGWEGTSGTSPVSSPIYWGSASGFSPTNVTSITTEWVGGLPIIVGPT